MKLRNEIQNFLEAHPGVTAADLAREAGCSAPTITRVLTGARKGMHCTTADRVRDAMARLSTPSAPIPTDVTTPHTPRARAQ